MGKKQTGNKFSKLCCQTGVSILLQLLLEFSLLMTAVFQRILVLTPLEVCALIFLTDALGNNGSMQCLSDDVADFADNVGVATG